MTTRSGVIINYLSHSSNIILFVCCECFEKELTKYRIIYRLRTEDRCEKKIEKEGKELHGYCQVIKLVLRLPSGLFAS